MKKGLWVAAAVLITVERFVFAAEVNITAGAQMEIDSPRCEIQPKYFMKEWTVSGGSSGSIPLKNTQTYPFSFKHDKNLLMTEIQVPAHEVAHQAGIVRPTLPAIVFPT